MVARLLLITKYDRPLGTALFTNRDRAYLAAIGVIVLQVGSGLGLGLGLEIARCLNLCEDEDLISNAWPPVRRFGVYTGANSRNDRKRATWAIESR